MGGLVSGFRIKDLKIFLKKQGWIPPAWLKEAERTVTLLIVSSEVTAHPESLPLEPALQHSPLQGHSVLDEYRQEPSISLSRVLTTQELWSARASSVLSCLPTLPSADGCEERHCPFLAFCCGGQPGVGHLPPSGPRPWEPHGFL